MRGAIASSEPGAVPGESVLWPFALRALSATPWRAIATLIVAQFVFLALLPFLVSSAPPLDVVEGLVWGREWLLGTHKLPPLPAWLIEISLHLTGSPILGPYLLSQICVALTYFSVFATGRRLTTNNNALAGTLLATGIVYFTWTTPEFNHNVIQMPIWMAAFLLFTMIREDARRPLPWLLLGALAGLGIYAKYSVVVLYAVLGLWLLLEGRMRRALLTPWPWAAGLLALAIAAPHVQWLVANHFAPLDYVRARSANDGSILPVLKWMLAQAVYHLPIVVLLLIAGRRTFLALPRRADGRSTLAYVAFLALAPAIATALLALVSGSRLQDMWGMPMFALSGLLVVLLLDRDWSEALVRRLWVGAICVVIVVGTGFTLNIVVSRAIDQPIRNAWPMAEIATKAQAAWTGQTQAQLKIVSGDKWLAGLVAAGTPERPHVLYDGLPANAPWLDDESLRIDGVLYVWRGEEPPSYLIPSDVPIAAAGTFEVSGVPDKDRIVGYAIRLPAQP
jgi:4-amino-4-deoxy-L-arabinose transferase-like glycosyltransferase